MSETYQFSVSGQCPVQDETQKIEIIVEKKLLARNTSGYKKIDLNCQHRSNYGCSYGLRCPIYLKTSSDPFLHRVR